MSGYGDSGTNTIDGYAKDSNSSGIAPHHNHMFEFEIDNWKQQFFKLPHPSDAGTFVCLYLNLEAHFKLFLSCGRL